MSIQVIERNGKPEWAFVPYETYLYAVDQNETLMIWLFCNQYKLSQGRSMRILDEP
jgi:hypothetical protein